MVTSVTNLGRSGLSDWVVQRVTAVVLAAYTIFLVGYIVCTPEVTYHNWSALFSNFWMRVFSLIALVSTVAHAWIGLWAVLTDYVTNRLMGPKATVMRAIVLFVYALVTVGFVVWGIDILWRFDN